MPTATQVEWIASHRKLCRAPFADIGSRVPVSRGVDSKVDYYSLKGLFPDESWTGIDMQPGREVDVVCDLSDELPATLTGEFSTVFLISVLEHVQRPWLMAENLKRMLAPGGLLFVSVPWTWRYHGHPHDYWRMSPQALLTLFDGLEWLEKPSCIWKGVNEKPLGAFEMKRTRPYADERKHLMHPITVNMVFRKVTSSDLK